MDSNTDYAGRTLTFSPNIPLWSATKSTHFFFSSIKLINTVSHSHSNCFSVWVLVSLEKESTDSVVLQQQSDASRLRCSVPEHIICVYLGLNNYQWEQNIYTKQSINAKVGISKTARLHIRVNLLIQTRLTGYNILKYLWTLNSL